MLKNYTELLKHIDSLEIDNNSYAAFDLDNTLLIGDIGEAVFSQLLNEKIISGFGWKNYLNLVQQDREKGYNKAISVMNGLDCKTIEDITLNVIHSKAKAIQIEDDEIVIPKANPIMQEFLKAISNKGIATYVVTASNEISAKLICKEFFQLPPTNVLGATISINEHNKIHYNEKSLPYAHGKVNTLKKHFLHKPLITGGDGLWDKYLLHHTAPKGIKLWLGNSNDYQVLKEELNDGFYQIRYNS